jgi:hypothetical protein
MPMEKPKSSIRSALVQNATGISVYIMGIKDRKHLAEKYGKRSAKQA